MRVPPSVSVIVPVFNEGLLLEESLAQMDRFLTQHFPDYEILVIESGSTDGSDALCDRMARGNPKIRVIHEGARKGLGAAVRLGFTRASKDLVWVIASDIPFSLESFLRAVPLLRDHDCVLSYRAKDPRSLYRRFQSWVYNLLVKQCLGLRCRSVNSAFKVFKRPVLQVLKLRSSGWLWDAEVLYRLQEKGIACAEIPVELVDRRPGRSSVGPMDFLSVLRELVHFMKTKNS